MRIRLVYGLSGLLLAVGLAACEEPDLSKALSGGRCEPGGKCAEGYVCVNDQCEPAGGSGGEAGSSPCGKDCVAPKTCCGTTCVSTSSDSNHCGACNEPCPGTICKNNECQNPPACLPGFLDCDKNVITGCEHEGTSCTVGDAAAD